jgi:hypothetical protein
MSDYLFDVDRSELGDAFDDTTKDELAELALSRSRATGRIVAVASFAGAGTATAYVEGFEEGELVEPRSSRYGLDGGPSG